MPVGAGTVCGSETFWILKRKLQRLVLPRGEIVMRDTAHLPGDRLFAALDYTDIGIGQLRVR